MSIWRNIMLFHYGNCRQEIDVLSKACEALKKENARITQDLDYANDALTKSVTRNHEQEAIYHYKLLELENEIAALRKDAENQSNSLEEYESKLSNQQCSYKYLDGLYGDLKKENERLKYNISQFEFLINEHRCNTNSPSLENIYPVEQKRGRKKGKS